VVNLSDLVSLVPVSVDNFPHGHATVCKIRSVSSPAQDSKILNPATATQSTAGSAGLIQLCLSLYQENWAT